MMGMAIRKAGQPTGRARGLAGVSRVSCVNCVSYVRRVDILRGTRAVVAAGLFALAGQVAAAKPAVTAVPTPAATAVPTPPTVPTQATVPTPPTVPTSAAKAPAPIVIERVLAVVGDAIVLESEVGLRAAPLVAELEEQLSPSDRQRRVRALLRQVLEELVDEELITQAAAEAELEVTAEEVDRAIDDVRRSNKMTDAQLTEALAAQGYSTASYRKEIRRNLVRMRAINVMVRPRVSVTDDDVRAFYDRTAAQSAGPTELDVAHLLVRVAPDAADDVKDAARRKAGELLARIRAGEDFAKVTLEASEDPASREAGGDLGWFKRGELPTEWEEALFTMAQGEVRGPIAGPQGLHLFKVVAVKREPTRPFEEQQTRLRQQLFGERMDKATRQWLEELRKKGHVELKAQPTR